MSSIPASQLVAVNPSVLTVGGNALDIIMLALSTSTRVPVGTVAPFSNPDSVSAYFGPGSIEDELASIYFGGFTGSDKLPGSILFAQYNQAAVAAYLRGGSLAALTLTQLQAITGNLAVVMDGLSYAANSIDLSAAASFSAAAATLQTDLNASVPQAAAFTASIATTVLTVTAKGSGNIGAGQIVVGAGVTLGTKITGQLTGTTGGIGTYSLSASQTVASESMTSTGSALAVTYDSVSSAFVITSGNTGVISTAAFATNTMAAPLKLTSATGAVTSQGAAAAVPATFMNGVVGVTTDWATFMTAFDPDGGSGNTVKQAFAAWKDTQNDRYAYICQDLDAAPTASVPAAASLGAILDANDDSGTILFDGDPALWTSTLSIETAAFVGGWAASIDFTRKNGRATLAFKQQAGLPASVTTATIADNLGGNPQTSDRGNGYNFYGTYGEANEIFTLAQRGFITGPFAWADSYINQIWANSQFRLALINLTKNSKSIPYNAAGNTLIESACSDVIQAGLNFGAWAPGTISGAQAAQVNNDAGADIAQTLQTQGYYLQVLPADSPTRAARTSPPCKFWYLDRGSVQAITLNSIAVQ